MQDDLDICSSKDRVSNLEYESVRICSKTVVFIRANPGKKETPQTDWVRMSFLSGSVHFSGSCKFREKWHVTRQKFRFAVTYFVPRPLTTASEATLNMTLSYTLGL